MDEAGNVTQAGTLAVNGTGDSTFAGNLRLNGILYDSSADAGISGQILSSTSTGTNWINTPSNMVMNGTITGATAGSILFAGAAGILQQDNANFFWDDTNNRLGIGTASPSGKLDISSASDTYLNILTTAGDSAPVITLYNGGYVSNSGAIAYNGALRFGTATGANASGWSEKMRIDSAGKVGIGTISPSAKLHIMGSGTVNAAGDGLGQDLTVEGANTSFGANSNMGNLMVSTNSAQAIDTGGSIAIGGRYNATQYATYGVIKAGKEDGVSGNFGGYLAFATRVNGGQPTERLRIAPSGNVGIGTTSTNVKLSLGNNVATGFLDTYGEYQIALYDSGTATGAYGLGIKGNTMVFNSGAGAYSFDRSGSTTSMYIDIIGNVGIGMTGPGEKLDVYGNIALGKNITGPVAAPAKIDLGQSYSNGVTRDKLKIYLYNSGTEQYGFGIGSSGDIQYHSNGIHDFYVANSQILRINSSAVTVANTLNANGGLSQDGNVILNGTDTWLRTVGQTGWFNATYNVGMYATQAGRVDVYNNASLYVANNVTATSFIDANNGGYYVNPDGMSQMERVDFSYGYDRNNGGYYIDLDNRTNLLHLTANGDIRATIFYDQNNTGYFVDPSGGSMIAGLTIDTPNESHLASTGDTYMYTQPVANAYVKLGAYDSSSGLMPLAIQPNGGTGILSIGAVSLDTNIRLDIAGRGTTSATWGLVVRDSGNATNNFWIRDDGAGWLRAAGWSYGSDRRMKENITDLNYGLDTVLALNPQKFDYISGMKNQLGFIAQDVQPIIPELVSTDNNGMLALQTDMLIPVIVNAMQEQQSEILNSKLEISNLVLKTDTDVTNLQQLQSSIDTQLGVVQASLAALATTDTQQATKLTDLETLAITLQGQIQDLQLAAAQNTLDITDAQLAMTNLEILLDIKADKTDFNFGHFTAENLETGLLTIKVVDEQAATIGTAVICPVGKKADASNQCTVDDAGADGKSVSVTTNAVGGSAKIFTSFENNPKTSSWIDKQKDGSGNYTGFIVHLDGEITSDVVVNWWIVESQ